MALSHLCLTPHRLLNLYETGHPQWWRSWKNAKEERLKDRGTQLPSMGISMAQQNNPTSWRNQHSRIVKNMLELWVVHESVLYLWNLSLRLFCNIKIKSLPSRKKFLKTRCANLWRDSWHPRVLSHYRSSYLGYRKSCYVHSRHH